MDDPLLIVALAAAVVAAGFVVAGVLALRRRRLLGFAGGVLTGLLLLALGALAGTLSLATRGYRALTHEEVAATVVVRPAGSRRFVAEVALPGGRRDTFRIRGDQLYVDARILKWTAVANVLGLHTAYELDRIGGRYVALEAERDSARSVYRLGEERRVDAFDLRRRYAFLSPLLDAEYGSGTFVMVERPDTLEVRVSTSGLLIRPGGGPGS